jgi:hypothetical protein
MMSDNTSLNTGALNTDADANTGGLNTSTDPNTGLNTDADADANTGDLNPDANTNPSTIPPEVLQEVAGWVIKSVAGNSRNLEGHRMMDFANGKTMTVADFQELIDCWIDEGFYSVSTEKWYWLRIPYYEFIGNYHDPESMRIRWRNRGQIEVVAEIAFGSAAPPVITPPPLPDTEEPSLVG